MTYYPLSFQPLDMADLLEYFETRSRVLDAEGQPVLEKSTLQFMSLIKFNGMPILPPVVCKLFLMLQDIEGGDFSVY